MDTLTTTQYATLEPYDAKRLATLCGQLNENLQHLATALNIQISDRGNLFQLSGDSHAVKTGKNILQHLYSATSTESEISFEQINSLVKDYLAKPTLNKTLPYTNPVFFNANNESPRLMSLKPKSPPQLKAQPRGSNQQSYCDNIRNYHINFGIGPAGTGKTYLAVACAIEALEQGNVSRIILARPAVEAGEKLGFLPGDISEKVDPYLRPLYDALHEMLGAEQVKRYLAKEIIEIAPLAYMRGRTLNQAFIILDESQNTTQKQMKMFLTRIGAGAKAVITGDPTQIDLGAESGLIHAQKVLAGIPEIKFNYFQTQDIVRHPLVQKIVTAYARFENARPHALPDSTRPALTAQRSKSSITISGSSEP